MWTEAIFYPLCFIILYFYLTPVRHPVPMRINDMDIQLKKWKPASLLNNDGALKRNDRLVPSKLRRVTSDGGFRGSESVTFDANNVMYGFVDGGVVMWDESALKTRMFCYTGGRPIDGAFDKNGDMYVVDVIHGLLKCFADKSKDISILTTSVTDSKGVRTRLTFADAIVVSKDGRYVYLSDATDVPLFRMHNGEYDLMKASVWNLVEGTANGRIVRYDTVTRQTELLASGLFFANGVALDKTEESLIFAETYRGRLSRLWLSGERAGTVEPFSENLPGFPDNVNYNAERDSYFVSFPALPPPILNFLHSSLIRTIVSKIPPALEPKPIHYGLVVEISSDGSVVASYHDPSGSGVVWTDAMLHTDGVLYLTGLETDYVSSVKL